MNEIAQLQRAHPAAPVQPKHIPFVCLSGSTRAKLWAGDFVRSEMSCYRASKELMPSYNLLSPLKPVSWKSPQLHLVSRSCQPSQGFTAPASCVRGLERPLVVPINHHFPFCLAVSIMGFHSLSIWLVSHSTEQTSELGDPVVSGSAIQPNILLLNVFRRGIPCAAAPSHATIPTDCQGWLAKLPLLVLQLTEDFFSAKERRSGTEKSH